MWHEARRQEKELRAKLTSDANRKAERHAYYEGIRKQPEEFMQVYGRSAKIHTEVVDESAVLRKWAGDATILIDRFDVRAHLDHFERPDKDDEGPMLSKAQKEEEETLDYERYRLLVCNEFLSVPEHAHLKTIATRELSSTKSSFAKGVQTEREKKRASQATKSAIGFHYEGSSVVKGRRKHDSDSDADADEPSGVGPEDDLQYVKLDVKNLDAYSTRELNRCGDFYRISEFATKLQADLSEAHDSSVLKRLEREKADLAGREHKDERAELRRQRRALIGTSGLKNSAANPEVESSTVSLSSFIEAAKRAQKEKKKRAASSSSTSSTSSESRFGADSRTRRHKRRKKQQKGKTTEKTEFITSIGDEYAENRHHHFGGDSGLGISKTAADVILGRPIGVGKEETRKKILELRGRLSESPPPFGEDEKPRSVKIGQPKKEESDSSGAETPLSIRSSMSEEERDRREILNRKRRIRRTTRMANNEDRKPRKEQAEGKRVAEKLRAAMQKSLQKTVRQDELEAQEKAERERQERRMRELGHSRRSASPKRRSRSPPRRSRTRSRSRSRERNHHHHHHHQGHGRRRRDDSRERRH